MSNNTDTKLMPTNQPYFERRDYAWMLATFILTPLTAAALAVTGFIAMDPLNAAIDGLLVSFMYVGFRVVNFMRRVRLRKRMLAQKQEPGSAQGEVIQ
ncbi:MAG: hypothetical protein IH631_04965 [Candidatus Thorarchaeota archaeon]|nr:hypothetical protein [Candidatus Thorarchaeota archaeon]